MTDRTQDKTHQAVGDAKSVLKGVKGLGDTIRGTVNESVDTAFNDREGEIKNKAVKEKGEADIQRADQRLGTSLRPQYPRWHTSLEGSMPSSVEEGEIGFVVDESRAMSISSSEDSDDHHPSGASLSNLRRFPNPFSASAFGVRLHTPKWTWTDADVSQAMLQPLDTSFPTQPEPAFHYTTFQTAEEEGAAKNRGYFQLMQGLPQSASDGHLHAQAEEIKTTPLFSNDVQKTLRGGIMGVVAPSHTPFPQYGLLGMREQTYNSSLPEASKTVSPEDNLIFANMNAPWSAFICGSQGAGKSHSLSCFLENSLLASSMAGENPRPLAGLVFHYDKFTSSESTQLCEAAYLCSSGIPVRVLVSPSNVHAMHKLYKNLPGLPRDAPRPDVIPLYFQENQLNVTRLMTLMAVDDKDKVPLYMEVLFKVLRDMTTEKKGTGGFDYLDFKARLSGKGFNSTQNGPLRLRLEVLESFLAHKVQTAESAARLRDMFMSAPGTLTVVDLSCPFVNENDACALFTICLSIFMESRADCGRVIALDEAHKFLTRSGEAEKLTDELTSIVRQQRHLASRIIVSTQEPTLAPRLIDLCNVCIVHRFSSPAWFEMLRDHLAGASRHKGYNNAHLFETIVGLQTGEALIFCPAALFDVYNGNVHTLKDAFIRARIRNRVTADGGRSILASDEMQYSGVGEMLTQELIRPFAAQMGGSGPQSGKQFGRHAGKQPGKQLSKAERRAVKAGRVTKSQPVPSQSQNLRRGLTHAQGRYELRSAHAPTQEPRLGIVQGSSESSAESPVSSAILAGDVGDVFAGAPEFIPLDPRIDPSSIPSRDILRVYVSNAVSESLGRNPRKIGFAEVRQAAARSAGLPEGFFGGPEWKAWSKRVINEMLVEYIEVRGMPQPKRH
ncbi:hypothetical protein AYO21_10267 [Fonsecaea monophora]|uniref:AAA+ ATPase domain-containing protein n=1 Tax=Fonsecaea monophora TaxID=254056 RepID=A0A177EU87_9EURO|nr:hypothetical protein AYO21_10267 [Fonsecaea monophora]OAG35528.1 hypothetical protein AYO21_10267 [Fonsecaea monophora]